MSNTDNSQNLHTIFVGTDTDVKEQLQTAKDLDNENENEPKK